MAPKIKRAQALDGSRRIERHTGFRGRPRLIEAAKMRERRGEREMRQREIAVCLDRPPEPRDRFFIRTEQVLCEARLGHPDIGERVPRTEPERLPDVGFRLPGAAENRFGVADESVREGQIAVELIPARTGFVAEAEATATLAEPSHHLAQDLRAVLEYPDLPYLTTAAALRHRRANRRLVHVQSHVCDIVHQARP